MDTTADNTWIGQILKTASGIFDSMHQWPAALLLFVVLTVLGVSLYGTAVALHRMSQKIPTAPARLEVFSQLLRHTTPMIVTATGMIVFLFVGDYPTGQRHPDVILAMRGFIIGFISSIIAYIAFRKFGKNLPSSANGETTHISKDDE